MGARRNSNSISQPRLRRSIWEGLGEKSFGLRLLAGREGMPCAVALWWEVKIYDTVGGTRIGSMPVGLKLLLGPEGRDTVPGRWLFRGWL